MTIYKVVTANLDVSEPPVISNYWVNKEDAMKYMLEESKEKDRKNILEDLGGVLDLYDDKSLEWQACHHNPAVYYRSYYGNYRCVIYIQDVYVLEAFNTKQLY